MTKLHSVMVSNVLTLDAMQSLTDACQVLDQQNAAFGVVVSPNGEPFIVTATVLAKASNQTEPVGAWAATRPCLLPASLDESLERVTLLVAHALFVGQNLLGLPVIDTDNTVVGVVPRAVLVRTATTLSQRGGDTSQLEGDATSTVGTLFICLQDNEEKRVIYYQPSKPPQCSQGHMMIPKR